MLAPAFYSILFYHFEMINVLMLIILLLIPQIISCTRGNWIRASLGNNRIKRSYGIECIARLTGGELQEKEQNVLQGEQKSDGDEDVKEAITEKISWGLKRRLFLDKIVVLSSTLSRSDNATLEDEMGEDEEEVTHQSDLRIPNRSIVIVTTAALPWMTGTAINPLLRAAHLCRYTQNLLKENELPAQQLVTLVLPWLELKEDREKLYGSDLFQNEKEQEAFIRQWMWEKAGLEAEACTDTGLKIIWYPARYHDDLGSIFAMGDICSLIPDSDSDICVLEEPEHLNWYRAPGDGWTTKFNYVVGVVHTNYKEYVSGQYHGLWTSPAMQLISAAMVRAYCHKVIKLSAVLQEYAPEKEKVINVHGVRNEFLQANDNINSTNYFSETNHTYFIGKSLWAKGFDKLLEVQDYYKQCTGGYFDIHIYGSGPDFDEIVRAFHGRKHVKMKQYDDRPIEQGDACNISADVNKTTTQPTNTFSRRNPLHKISNISKIDLDTIIPKSRHELRRTPISNAIFLGRIDHIHLAQGYKIFINPSMSEVLCTTTAEALAMGKFVIIPVHPSNDFFMKFPNCLAYRNKLEFAANLRWALLHSPEPLSSSNRQDLTWEAATQRFIKAAAITKLEAHYRAKLGKTKLDERIAWFHNQLGKGVKGDTIRKVLGAGPVSDQVRYTLEKQQELEEADLIYDTELTYEDEEDDGILPKKFSKSAFVEALRSSLKLGLFSNSNSTDDS